MLAANRNRKAMLSEILAEIHSESVEKRALVVEANPNDLITARMELMDAGYAKIDVALSLRLAFELTKMHDYDVILVDYVLPDGNGLELLEWMDDESDVVMISGAAAGARKSVVSFPAREQKLVAGHN